VAATARVSDALAAPATAGSPSDLALPAHLAARPSWSRLLVTGGRLAAVAVPVTSVHMLAPGGGAPAPQSIAAATAIWFLALRSAYGATKPSPLALGVAITSAIGCVAGLAAVSVVSFWVPGLRIAPGEAIGMTLAVFACSVALERVVASRARFRRRVLIAGASPAGVALCERLQTTRFFECIGIVDERNAAGALNGGSALGCLPDLRRTVLERRPEIVVLASAEAGADVVDSLLDARLREVRVVDVPAFYEHAFGLVPVTHLSPSWFLGIVHLYRRPFSRFSKRVLDLTLCGVGLLLAAPLFPLLAWLVRRSGPGPILYRQTRLGEGGATFEMLKFRTMIDGAEEPASATWAAINDPRVTRVGRYLRTTRLDELPQLWNVVRGEMSIVGPRPERPEFLDLLQREVPFFTRRHLVKPGLTGWAQVRCGYASDSDGTLEKLSCDLYYLKHRSLLMDLAIVAKTVRVVLSGFGAR
jgi:exopolysaccharide biosynthesis polyprenyl glycosylphosphotransferase